MKKFKILLVTGYNDEQKHSIDIEEAHKAYYLFLNPQKRGIFKNGLALEGKQINQIIPDWHGTMGWSRTYKLDMYDYQEIEALGVEYQIKSLMAQARVAATFIESKPEISDKKLTECIEYLNLDTRSSFKALTEGLSNKISS